MENTQLDLDNLTKEDFMEMAKYCHHLESQNRVLLEQLREAKAAVLATVQQRNSLNAKLQNLVSDRINTIDISAIQTEIVSNVDFTNPEMYAVPKERLGLSEKADRI
jgi:hypothetical protein